MENLWVGFSWWRVIASVVLAQVFGFIWYGPIFGKLYRKENGISEEGAKAGIAMMPMMMVRETVTRLIYFIGLWLLLGFVGLDHKWTVGFLYFHAVLSTEWSGTIWSKESRKLCLIKTWNKAIATLIALWLYWML